jgi:hypothetical protein
MFVENSTGINTNQTSSDGVNAQSVGGGGGRGGFSVAGSITAGGLLNLVLAAGARAAP